MSKSHYETLGVDTKANKDEIKKAYRQLSMKYHPDKNGGSVEKSQELNEAYEILKDDETRMQYDQQQQGSPFPFPFHAGHSDLDDILGALFGGSMNGVHVKMNMGGMNMGGMNMSGMHFAHMGGMPFGHMGGMPFGNMGNVNIGDPNLGNHEDIDNLLSSLFGASMGGMPPGANIRIFRSGPGGSNINIVKRYDEE